MSSQLQLGDWAPSLKTELGQYHTPVRLARKMVAWAHLPRGAKALEPSAGGGNIVRELVTVGADVTAVEIDPEWATLLADQFDARVVCADFLAWEPPAPFDIAVMNPNLDGGVAGVHVAKALEVAHRAVSVLRVDDLTGVQRYQSLWRKCDLAGVAYLVHRPVFKGDGGMTDFCVVDVWRPGTFQGTPRIEHWPDRWNT